MTPGMAQDFRDTTIAAEDPGVSPHKRSRFIIAAILAFLILLALATLRIAAALVEHAVERDASRRSLEWAEFAVRHVPQIAALAQGATPEPQNWKEFDDLAHFAGVFRFKIFSPDGVLRFESDDPTASGSTLGTHNSIAAAVVTTGQSYTSVADGRDKPDRPDLYSETYLPVYDNGRLVAIAETYMDQTSKTAAVKLEYAAVGAVMAGILLLALSIPSAGLWIMFHRLKLKNMELRKARIRAQASDKSKSEFISTVSHELRTPLTSIKGSLDMLQSGKIVELTGTAERLVALAAKNAGVLHLLVNDLLDFGKLDTGNLEITTRPTDLVALAQDEIEAIKSYGSSDIRFRYSGSDGPLVADIDADRIAQVLRNLLSNAVKFTPNRGTVDVAVSARQSTIRVHVKDTGCGIPRSEHRRIFDKFTQVDSSNTRQHRGTGLGLAISKGIVEAHGGHIGVSSAPGDGSDFFFELPIGNCTTGIGDAPLHAVA